MIKAIIARGIGFTLGTISYIPTHGFSIAVAFPFNDGTVLSISAVNEVYGATPSGKVYGADPVM